MASVGTTTAGGAASGKPQHHPAGFWFFFWGEFAERCSYYGMRAILLLYLIDGLHFGKDNANSIYAAFKMIAYFLPLLGGFLADRYFGKYWTIVGFSVPYVLGHFILGIDSQVALFVALALLAGGSGVIKPNISTLMGMTYDQQRPGQKRLRSSAFNWFYFAINVGAVISTFTLPQLRDWGLKRWDPQPAYALAFQFPAWLMVMALFIFALGKRFYAVEKIERKQLTAEERQQRRETLSKLFGVFGLMIFFWMAYEHNDSLWVLFSRHYVDRVVPWYSSEPIPPDQIQFLNPLFVLILIPFFSFLFGRIDPQLRIFTPTRKILLGFLGTALAVATLSAAGFLAERTGRPVSIAWMVASYIILTVGEVLLYGTGLELAYTAAPENMKGFVTACFLLTNTLGNFINTFFTRLYGGELSDPYQAATQAAEGDQRGALPPGIFFAITAGIVLVASIAFYFVGKAFDRQQSRAANQANA